MISLILNAKESKSDDILMKELRMEHGRLFTAGTQILASGAHNASALERRILQMRTKGAPESEIETIVKIHKAREKNALDQMKIMNTYADRVLSRANTNERELIDKALEGALNPTIKKYEVEDSEEF